MGLVRGVGFRNIEAFVLERFGDQAWAALLTALPPGDRALLQGIVPSGWYDLAAQARLRRAVVEELGRGELDLMEELGRFEAERDLGGTSRWFFRILSPEFAIRRMDLYWRRFHDSGRWSTEAGAHGVTARLHGWSVVDEALCRSLGGYLERTVELISERRSKLEHGRCCAHGDPCCEFAIRWRLLPSAPPTLPVSTADVAAIARELSQIDELSVLASTIVTLLSTHFPCRRVLLRDGPSADAALLARAGLPGPCAAPHHILLEAQGRVVGRIEIEMEGGLPLGESFDALLPLLGVSLAAVPRPVDRGAEREALLEAAAARWKLTPRQASVLRCIARGLSNKEIADELRINDGTVEIHVTQILRKSGAESRTGLLALVWS